MQELKILKDLLVPAAISGFEDDFSELLKNKVAAYCTDVKKTKSGCVVGKISSAQSNGKSILLEAHLDQIGLIVSEICDDGFVKFMSVGGVDERILPTSEVYILGKERVYGVIGAKPPHLLSDDAKDASLKIEDMMIDTGLNSDTLCDLVSVGDAILLRSDFSELKNGCIASAALDNRAGMTAIFSCLEQIKNTSCPYDIYIAFTTGEETGLHGAYTLPETIKPSLAVVVDVTHGTTPDAPKVGTFPLGSGTAICRGPNLHFEYTKSVVELAKNRSIPYEIEVSSGHSGTNAWALQNLGGGIPCVLLSVPLRYMHTSVEVVNVSDIENTAKLLCEIVSGGVSLA